MNLTGLKVLIIEDDLILSEELKEQLTQLGYTVEVASNSSQALELFATENPNLILCDIRLTNSKLDGIEIIKIINKIRSVPVVFLTAYGDKDTVERAKKVNPAYYLIKPSNVTQLKIALDFAISNFVNNIPANIKHSLQYHEPPLNSFYLKQDYFFAKKDDKYVRIEISDIIWVEALGANVQIFTEKNKVFLAATLNSFLNQVRHNSLLRIHRSYVININKIKAFDGGRVFVEYQTKQIAIPIGSTFRTKFKGLFNRLKSD